MNKELTRLRTERTEANNATIKDQKLEIMMWRKLLGRERSLKMTLEKKITREKGISELHSRNCLFLYTFYLFKLGFSKFIT